MNDLVQTLYQSFYDISFFALFASFLWGLLSVILSPCHLASIPLIVGYVNNKQMPDTKRAFVISLLFGLGILTMLIIVGVLTSLTGRILGDVGDGVLLVADLFLLACGVWLLDLPIGLNVNLNFFNQNEKTAKMGAFSLGFLYGLILGPCSFAFLAPMIGIVFTQATSEVWFGILLFVMFGIGHTTTIVLAGTFGSKLTALFGNEKMRNLSLWIKRFCGVFIILYCIYNIIEILGNM